MKDGKVSGGDVNIAAPSLTQKSGLTPPPGTANYAVDDARITIDETDGSIVIKEGTELSGEDSDTLTFTVTVSEDSDTYADYSVDVGVKLNKVTGITFDPAPEATYGDTSASVSAAADVVNSAGTDVEYSSSNTGIAEVEPSTGALTIKATGEVTITAKSVFDPSVSTNLSVTIAKKDIGAFIFDGLEVETYVGVAISNTPITVSSGLVGSDVMADAVVFTNPSEEPVTVSAGGTVSIADTVAITDNNKEYTVTVEGKGNYTGSRTLSLKLIVGDLLKKVIESGKVPSDLSTYSSLVRTVLEPYAVGADIEARYVAASSQGSGNAGSWANAAGDIKATMDNIADAEANKIYLVLLASGTHMPTATLAMKNHVAIVGGWNEWEHTGTSTISGVDARRVFNNSGIDRTALLYGVTIANGKSSGDGGGMYNDNSSPTLSHVTFSGNTASDNGGGMANYKSSPTLSHVSFSGNTASDNGGGMANYKSSPTLSHITFSGNTAGGDGGGMNNDNSSPILSYVTFSGNTASVDGGGMNNVTSSPILSYVTFSGNTATYGGGMDNRTSSPTLSHVTFSGNTAKYYGGGMFNDNDGGSGPTIVNSLFWNNKDGANSTTVGQQIYMNNETNSGAENMTIAFSLVQHGIEATSGATSDDNANDGLGFFPSGSDPVTVTQTNVISGDPMLADLADNGGFVKTIALSENSAAIDKGVYVQRSGTPGGFTFYYSEDSTSWFTDLTLSNSETPPGDAIDLSASDARGYTRNGRPDIGAYEYDGTAP